MRAFQDEDIFAIPWEESLLVEARWRRAHSPPSFFQSDIRSAFRFIFNLRLYHQIQIVSLLQVQVINVNYFNIYSYLNSNSGDEYDRKNRRTSLSGNSGNGGKRRGEEDGQYKNRSGNRGRGGGGGRGRNRGGSNRGKGAKGGKGPEIATSKPDPPPFKGNKEREIYLAVIIPWYGLQG